MTTTITRRFEFDAAHRVLGHEGKCRHIHGHRYMAEVTVIGPELDALGRVIDFSVLKNRIGEWIAFRWDHNILLHPYDPLVKIAKLDFIGLHFKDDTVGCMSPNEVFASKEPFICSWNGMGDQAPFNPTAENLAKYLFTVVETAMQKYGIACVNVRMWETLNCYADYNERNIQ